MREAPSMLVTIRLELIRRIKARFAMTEGEIAALAKAANLEHSETFTGRFGFTINFRKPDYSRPQTDSGLSA